MCIPAGLGSRRHVVRASVQREATEVSSSDSVLGHEWTRAAAAGPREHLVSALDDMRLPAMITKAAFMRNILDCGQSNA